MTRAYNTATTQQNSGGAVAGVTAGKNAIINGGMDIWQRGTSFTIPSSSITYTADRWAAYRGATGATVTRQTTSDSTNLPFIQYCTRIARDSGNTSTAGLYFAYSFDSVNTIPFAGKTVTFSYYARRGANYSATSNLLVVQFYTGTGTDQNVINGYTGNTTVLDTTSTLTTTWQRFTHTFTIASTATEMGFNYVGNVIGTAGAADYYDITGIQLEVGSVATPFSRAGGTIQGELAACQRYYYQAASNTIFGMYGWFFAYNTTTGRALVQNPVPMRTAATSVTYSNLTINRWGSGTFPFTTLVIQDNECNTIMTTIQLAGASGLTANTMYQFANNNNAAGYLGISAEL
jgi:hypothetical protein